MALSSFWDDDDEEEEYEAGISGADKDSALDEDIEALKRACMLTGRNPIEIGDIAADSNSGSDGSDEIDDLELVRSIQERFSLPLTVNSVPGMSKSSIFRTSTDSDEEDDFETLRAIQRRFAKYESSISEKDGEKHLLKAELAYAISTPSKQETPIVSFESETNSKALGEEFPDSDDNDTLSMLQPLGSFFDGSSRNQPSGFIEWHRPEVETCILSAMPLKTSTFPKSGQMFIDAIKKNRACQKFIRSKLIEIEAKIEGNKELKGRIKCLVDFQASCKRKAGQVFCQKKDARFKLISLPKSKKQKEW